MHLKRRDFMINAAMSCAGLSFSACSSIGPRRFELKPKISDFTFDVTHQKPTGGTMPMGEIGGTGIKVSKFSFGAHMPKELVPYQKEREFMIREAYDLGINLFDIYDDGNWKIYQYEPMGRYLAPVINDVVISIIMSPYDGRTTEQEFVRMLKLFNRDYIDMVRVYSTSPEQQNWGDWDKIFKLKEKGYIRAVGLPIHYEKEIKIVLETQPIDYVILPYNFYHNLLYDGSFAGDLNPLVKKLREKKIGVVTMKPFGTDWFVQPLIRIGKKLDKTKEISVPQAMLRHIINSGLNPDTTLGGMYSLDNVYENVCAYFNPEMSADEKTLLEKMKEVSKIESHAWMPKYYKFLEKWASRIPHDRQLYSEIKAG